MEKEIPFPDRSGYMHSEDVDATAIFVLGSDKTQPDGMIGIRETHQYF